MASRLRGRWRAVLGFALGSKLFAGGMAVAATGNYSYWYANGSTNECGVGLSAIFDSSPYGLLASTTYSTTLNNGCASGKGLHAGKITVFGQMYRSDGALCGTTNSYQNSEGSYYVSVPGNYIANCGSANYYNIGTHKIYDNGAWHTGYSTSPFVHVSA